MATYRCFTNWYLKCSCTTYLRFYAYYTPYLAKVQKSTELRGERKEPGPCIRAFGTFATLRLDSIRKASGLRAHSVFPHPSVHFELSANIT